MKIVYILKGEPAATGKVILDEHKKTDEVTVIDIIEDHDYDGIVDIIVSSDRVISW